MSDLNWSLKNIPDLTGKTIIVTGGNSGLGFEAVKAFSSKNARVIMACRSVSKAEKAREMMMNEIPKAEIILMELDLSDLQSIRNFASKYKQNHSHLDILLNNAGIMMPPYGLTKDGFENQMGTNHLGHFALAGLIHHRIKERIISVSSVAHRIGNFGPGTTTSIRKKCLGEGPYSPWRAYGASKLANLLFINELERRRLQHGYSFIPLAAHPGFANTRLTRVGPAMAGQPLKERWMGLMTDAIGQSAHDGALPMLYAASMPGIKGATYYGPRKWAQMRGTPMVVHGKAMAYDQTLASNLWNVSEELTGVAWENSTHA